MSRLDTRVILVPALVMALAAAGCGGSDGSDGSSSKAGLVAARSSVEIQAGCGVVSGKQAKLTDSTYPVVVDDVGTLISSYQKNPDLKVPLDRERPDVPIQKIVKDAIAALNRCGPDGRQQARRLQRGVAPR